jgi:hypothetical protein
MAHGFCVMGDQGMYHRLVVDTEYLTCQRRLTECFLLS